MLCVSLNCLSAVEAIGSRRASGRQSRQLPAGLNCLSAVEAIGSRREVGASDRRGLGLNCLSAVEAIGRSSRLLNTEGGG